MKKILISYIPVLHEGYRRFIEENNDADVLYIFSQDIIDEFDYLSKEIRQLDPELIKKSIDSWGTGIETKLLTSEEVKKIQDEKPDVVMPNEDVVKLFADKYLKRFQITYSSIFLRWDRHSAPLEKALLPDHEESSEEFQKRMMDQSEELATNSADFWRHVGAMIIKDGEVILSGYNKHVPSDHKPYAEGDPRNGFHKGVHLELSTVLHIESGLIAEAARKGVALEGAEMYVTTFPCPPCAKSIAYSGIKKLYYRGGYDVLDADRILKDRGVEIIWVK